MIESEQSRQGTFSIPIRVYYEDTDAGGLVYYANYLKFMERARTEWLRGLGFEQDALSVEEGVIFAVRAVKVDFYKPGRFNDLLQATVNIRRRGGASLTLKQEVQRNSTTLCEAEVKLACLDAQSLLPRSIPNRVVLQLDTVILS
ncbi:MAG: tol-pal system-associated acyl-CoA thioesterase [Gammaproteobacteria bacterium]|jgi:acyl-CoA thioester hydrolase|nr:tol-pal system-associated acyl-CoA thioesterase [Pseudomonadota bacterium]MCZ6731586.1 tol-pal system-associated acyl-CoA thioesterase [Gammaproteobacteria bacterium]TDJ66067.1 MAG: tol-pal system-associated acyl-CoA thioesterase [Pseudomonadota bacterium]TDJ72551.1 MAG: tol-pal system-associated acyl-CoA thioesterase [Pseudomonadota bacterium]